MARVAINTGASPNDGTGNNLQTAGGIINNNFLEIYSYLGLGSTTILSAPIWNSSTLGISTTRNVGLGTTNPASRLSVIGNGYFSGILTASSFSGTATTALNATTAANLANAANITAGTINASRLSGNYNINISGTAATATNLANAENITTGTINPSRLSGTYNINVSGNAGYANTSGISTLSQNLTGTPNINVGVITANNAVIGGATTSLVVTGNTRITGILTIGTSSITLDGSSDKITVGSGVTIDGNTGIISARSVILNGSTITGAGVTFITPGSGISINQSTGNVVITATGVGGSTQWVTTASGIHTTSNVGIATTNPRASLQVGTGITMYGSTGIISATKYYGDGSGLTGVGGGSGISVVISDTEPTSPTNGNLWYDSSLGRGFIYYSDEDSSQWVDFSPSGSGGQGQITITDNDLPIGFVNNINFGDNLSVSYSSGVATVTGSTPPQWVTTASGIHTNSNVGIGTTNPQTKLQVERYGLITGFGTFNASVGVSTVIDSFTISVTDFKTAEYTLHFINSGNIQSQKVLVMQNGTIAFSQEYGIMFQPNQIVSVGATISGGSCRLQVTPEIGISGITTYRLIRQTLL